MFGNTILLLLTGNFDTLGGVVPLFTFRLEDVIRGVSKFDTPP